MDLKWKCLLPLSVTAAIVCGIVSMVGCCSGRSLPHAPAEKHLVMPASAPVSEDEGETVDILVVIHPETKIYQFKPNEPCTIMHLIFKMGGLSPYVDHRDAKIIRKTPDGKEQEIWIKVQEILESGDPKKDVPLQHGDRVIFAGHILAI